MTSIEERTCLALVNAVSNFCPQLKDLRRGDSTVVPTIGNFFRRGLPFRRHGQAFEDYRVSCSLAVFINPVG
jgi:hypothetical protein